jgi:hypothetical protein
MRAKIPDSKSAADRCRQLSRSIFEPTFRSELTLVASYLHPEQEISRPKGILGFPYHVRHIVRLVEVIVDIPSRCRREPGYEPAE